MAHFSIDDQVGGLGGPYDRVTRAPHRPQTLHSQQDETPTEDADPVRPGRAGALAQYSGAALSLALIIGVGVWGYNLLVRDVSGVPVVRAMEGPMREAASNPGGDVALNRGLAVNEVAAVGTAQGPEDRLVLAPQQLGLLQEDLDTIPETARPAPQSADAEMQETVLPLPATALVPPPLTPEQVLALANAEAESTTPVSDIADATEAAPVGQEIEDILAGILSAETGGDTAEITDAASPSANSPDAIPTSVPGIARSLRPNPRPTTLAAMPAVEQVTQVSAEITAAPTTAAPATAAPATAASGAVAFRSDELPIGTNVVQFGAYETPELAAAGWTTLQGQFGDLMASRERVIQEATSGGRQFYRLRAMGFDDLNEARRFCSALVAEDAACIPVVVR